MLHEDVVRGAPQSGSPEQSCYRQSSVISCILCNIAEGVGCEGHFKRGDTHKVADTAYPDEELVPGFK